MWAYYIYEVIVNLYSIRCGRINEFRIDEIEFYITILDCIEEIIVLRFVPNLGFDLSGGRSAQPSI
ncbi:hypothetical protein GCM10027442_06340 [Emticicia fontis]